MLLSFVFFVAEIHKFYSNFSANVWLSSPLFIILFLSFYPVDEKNSSTSKSYGTHTAASHKHKATATSKKRARQTTKTTHITAGEEKEGRFALIPFASEIPSLAMCSELTFADAWCLALCVNGIVRILKENMNFIIADAIINISHVHLLFIAELLHTQSSLLSSLMLFHVVWLSNIA